MHHSGRCGSFELRANGSRFKRTACLWVAKAGGRVHSKCGVCPPVHHPGRCGSFVPWLFVCGLMWLRGCTACKTKQSRSVHPARGCDSEAWLVFSGSLAARQYWRAILAGNIGGHYWRAILAGNIALQYWSGATARGFLSASECPAHRPAHPAPSTGTMLCLASQSGLYPFAHANQHMPSFLSFLSHR